MNKAMRKELDGVLSMLDELDVDNIDQTLTDLQAEEQEKFDNLSEGLQAADKGQAIEAAADNLQNAIDAVDTIRDAIQEVRDYIEAAAE